MAVSAAALLALRVRAHGAVAVEQIEAGAETGTYPNITYSQYAPVEFGGSPTVVGTSYLAGITFHAIDTANDTDTSSSHAYYVAVEMYDSYDPAYAYVTNVFCEEADDFLLNTVQTQNGTGVGPLPGTFAAGVQVVNNSWDGSYTANGVQYTDTNMDALRRFDYMVNAADVVSVAGVDGSGSANPIFWACYNTIGVAGANGGFSPTGSPTKQHIDLYTPSFVSTQQASYGAGLISGYAAALIGEAQTAGQTDGEFNYVVRSLLFTGTDKTIYTNPGGGSLGGMDPNYGAGEPDYSKSLSILEAGEKSLLTVGSGSAVSGTPATVQFGWATGTVAKGTQDVVLFQSANELTGITASLNWNVTSQTSGGNINTSNAALIFPNLTLEVRPVTFNSSTGKYVLGTSESNALFHSSVSEDNTQYISANVVLSAGTYALLIDGDSALPAAVGVSYLLSGSFASQWNSSTGGSWGNASLWTNGIPDGQGAQANFLASPGLTSAGTITLDGDRVVGQMTFNNSNGYTIAPGTTPAGNNGQITIDDTGDSTGTANPLITVLSGGQTITPSIFLINGVTTNISSGSTLTVTGTIAGSGVLTKNGAGTLTLANANTYSSTSINGGTLILTPAATVTGGPITVNSGGTLNFAASGASGILTRNLAVALNVNTSGTVVVAPTAVTANRQLIVATGGLSISGSLNNWTGKLDLTNNDLDVPNGNLTTLTNQLKQGYNSGTWNGTGGIVSSSAAANTAHLTTLGIILNTTNGTTPLYSSGTPLGTFDGSSPAATDVLIKYTYYGDTNLDGKVDGSDYARIDNGYLMKLAGWYNGDFNYDGVINGSDYTLIDNAYNTQGAQIEAAIAAADALATAQIAASSAPTSAMPEPVGLLSLALLFPLARRQPRSRPVLRRVLARS
jgi:autotransporter-associated beta strand protein